MLVVVAAVFTIACVSAAFVRLTRVVQATSVDAGYLGVALGARSVRSPPDALFRVRAHTAGIAGAEWEHDVAEALLAPADARAALLGEALTELEFRTRRWARVPRVCASLTSSFGFLLATAALRAGLSDISGGVDDATVLTRAAFDAVDVMAVGLVGTAFCISVLYRSRAAAAAQLSGGERLIDVLERLVRADGGALAAAQPRANIDALDAAGGPAPQIV